MLRRRKTSRCGPKSDAIACFFVQAASVVPLEIQPLAIVPVRGASCLPRSLGEVQFLPPQGAVISLDPTTRSSKVFDQRLLGSVDEIPSVTDISTVHIPQLDEICMLWTVVSKNQVWSTVAGVHGSIDAMAPQSPSPEDSTNMDGGTPDLGGVETEVHQLFGKVYSVLMRSCSEASSGTRDYQVFLAVVRMLLSERRFFPRYPVQELATTAVLIGLLIREGLLIRVPYKTENGTSESTAHAAALQAVADAWMRDVGSKLFCFAVTATAQFISRPAVLPPAFLKLLAEEVPAVRVHCPTWAAYAQEVLQVMPLNSTEIPSSQQLPPPPVGLSEAPAAFDLPAFVSRLHTQQQQQYKQEQYLGGEVSGGGSTSQAKYLDVPSGALPPQRQLVLNGQQIDLTGFSLGSVEALLTSDDLLRVLEPPEQFQDRVAQAFNSVAPANLGNKVAEVNTLLGTSNDWLPWLALYIVKSRCSKETNHHQLYLSFVERLKRRGFMDQVIQTSHECVYVLLSYVTSALESSSFRTVLKNLGNWLGCITLARNVALRSKYVDLKSLLFDGYEHGRLRGLLPLVCKIIEHVNNSRTFRLPCPWTATIFNILGEIHKLPGLTTALVFEIEVLFKSLNLNVTDFHNKSNHLSKRAAPPPNSADFNRKTNAAPFTQGANVAQSDAATNFILDNSAASATTVAANTAAPEQFVPTNMGASILPQLHLGNSTGLMPGAVGGYGVPETTNYAVKISPALVLFQTQPSLKHAIPHAIERAIRDVVRVVADRAVTIAIVSAREIVSRDYCCESSDALYRRAAHLMVASMAGSLAYVTAREPLRAAIAQQLRLSLAGACGRVQEDPRLIDQVVAVLSNDNLDLACSIIERNIIQRALNEVEAALADQVAERKRARQEGQQRNFVSSAFSLDASRVARWPASLRRALLPHKGSVTGSPMQVYKDFLSLGPLRRFHLRLPNGMPILRTPETTVANLMARMETALAHLKELVSAAVISCTSVPHVESELLRPREGWKAQYAMLPCCSNSAVSSIARLPANHPLFAAIYRVLAPGAGTAEHLHAVAALSTRLLRAVAECLAANRQRGHVQTAARLAVLRAAPALMEVLYSLIALCVSMTDEATHAEITQQVPIVFADEGRVALAATYGLWRNRVLSAVTVDRLLANKAAQLWQKGEVSAVVDGLVKIILQAAISRTLRPALSQFSACRELLLSPEVIAITSENEAVQAANEVLATAQGQPPHPLLAQQENVTVDGVLDLLASYVQPPAAIVVRCRPFALPAAASPSGASVTAQPGTAALAEALFLQWHDKLSTIAGPERRSRAWNAFFQSNPCRNVLQMDQTTGTFLVIAIQTALARAVNSEPDEVEVIPGEGTTISDVADEASKQRINLRPLDSLAKFVGAVVRLTDGAQAPRLAILEKVLTSLTQMIYYKTSPGAGADTSSLRLLARIVSSILSETQHVLLSRSPDTSQLCQVYRSLFFEFLLDTAPRKVPAFIFLWLDLLTHKLLLPRLASSNNSAIMSSGTTDAVNDWSYLRTLLEELFLFMGPLLVHAPLSVPVKQLHKALLRMLVLLSNDYPEFFKISGIWQASFVPLEATQMRNIMLGGLIPVQEDAYPKRLSETCDLKDSRSAAMYRIISTPVSRCPEFCTLVIRTGLDQLFGLYARTEEMSVVRKLSDMLAPSDLGEGYDNSRMNCVVDHLVMQTAERIQRHSLALAYLNGENPITAAATPLEIEESLNAIFDLDEATLAGGVDRLQMPWSPETGPSKLSAVRPTERLFLYLLQMLPDFGRYKLMSALSNILQRPSIATIYGANVMLWLFTLSKSNSEVDAGKTSMTELIMRVLLERLQSPVTWGIKMMLTELLSHEDFGFWKFPYMQTNAIQTYYMNRLRAAAVVS